MNDNIDDLFKGKTSEELEALKQAEYMRAFEEHDRALVNTFNKNKHRAARYPDGVGHRIRP